MIKPTVGRVVLFTPQDGGAKLCSLITRVYSDTCVNLAIFDEVGSPVLVPPTSIPLVQPGEDAPVGSMYCEWLPYQQKKSYGSESGEKDAGTQGI